MGFTNASGQEVDVRRRRRADVHAGRDCDADGAARQSGARRRLRRHQRRQGNGDEPGRRRAGLPRRRLPGAERRVARLLASIINATTTHFTVSGAGLAAPLAISAKPTPMATLSLDDGAHGRPAHVRPDDEHRLALGPEPRGLRRRQPLAACMAAGRVGCRIESVNVAGRRQDDRHRCAEDDRARARDRRDRGGPSGGTAMSENALLAVAAAKTGTNRFRYAPRQPSTGRSAT